MFAVWGGISGAQTTLLLLLTHGPEQGVTHERIAEAFAAAPARRLGLEGKGGLLPGADADLALVRADAGWQLHRGRPPLPPSGVPVPGHEPHREGRAHDPARRDGPRPGRVGAGRGGAS